MAALIQDDLNKMKCPCGEGKEGPIAIHSTCHIEAPLWPWYFAGMIRLECSECHATVAVIKVAKS